MKLDVQEEIHDQFCSYNPAFSPYYNPLNHQYGYQDREYCLKNCQTRFTFYCEKCGNAVHYQSFNKDTDVFMVPHNCNKCNPIEYKLGDDGIYETKTNQP